uniref:hypothetical protein n=1 Tax=Faecalibacterium sp. TaxID=1971605 RepID=UPI003FF15472
ALLHAVLLTAGNNDCVHLFHSFSLYSLVVKAGPHGAVSGAHTMRLEYCSRKKSALQELFGHYFKVF